MPGAPVRVLVVSYVSTAWGAQLRLLEQAPHLRDDGIDLRLASPPDGPLPERWRALGLGHVDLRIPPARGLRPEGRGGGRPDPLALAREAAVVARSAAAVARLAGAVHVVHSHSLDAHVAVSAAGRLARRPTVLDVHDLVVPGIGRRLLHLAGRGASACIANSTATAAMLPAERTTVIHPGVDVERFTPGPARADVRAELGATGDDDLVVGVLGRFDPEKRIELVARAVAAAAEGGARPLRLAVIGGAALQGATYEAELRAELAGLLGDRVRLVGRRDDVPEVMRALDVVVNANDAEPFGRTILEAQASGRAVVGVRGGGVPDFVHDGETGLLVAPGDHLAMAAALRRLAADDGLRARLGQAGCAQAVASFSLAGQCRRVADVYRRVARPAT